MNKYYRHLIENQAKVKVVARAEENPTQPIKFAMLATFFAGIFYFLGNNLWTALSGG
jgi:hypothetical protein